MELYEHLYILTSKHFLLKLKGKVCTYDVYLPGISYINEAAC